MSVDKVFEALAHPTRRAVLELLRARREMTAGDIAETLQVSKPTLSGHLNVLKAAELIHGEREGTTIRYRVDMTVIEETLHTFLGYMGARGDGRDTRPHRGI